VHRLHNAGMPQREIAAGMGISVHMVLDDLESIQREGEMMVETLWADCLEKLKFKRTFASALCDDPFASCAVMGSVVGLLDRKIKAGNFLLKVQAMRQKQEEAMKRSGKRSAFSDQRSAGGREGRDFAEESIVVDQTEFERQSTPPTAGHAPIDGQGDRFAEESGSVDQRGPA